MYFNYVIKCFLVLILAAISSLSFGQELKQGHWRGSIHYNKVEVPFIFHIKVEETKPVITLINNDEHRAIHGSQVKGDSIFIPMDVFDATIKARFHDNKMSGEWVKHYRGDTGIPFSAQFDQPRFPKPATEPPAIESKWKLTFQPEEALDYAGVALFEQNGNKLTGTVMTGVGDFRYFEGVIEEDSFSISSFDGSHAFLMVGKRTTNDVWEGDFYFDPEYSEPWVGVYDKDASLKDPFEMVTVEKSTYRPYFDILGAGSGKGAIDESKYFSKVLIIQLFGTWCPNSFDQTNYLMEWYEKNQNREVEILAVTYEPNYSKEYGEKRIDEYKKAMQIPYEIVLGGRMSKGQAALAFPFLDKINAFPTLVILDKEGYVRYVHSYFNGPATGMYYEQFDQRFNTIIEELLSE